MRTNSAARDEIARLVVPGQRVESQRAHALEHGRGARVARHFVERLFLDEQFVEADHAARDHGFGALIPGQLVAALQLRREVFQQVGLGERRRELDARLAFAIVEIDRDDEFLARDGLGAANTAPRPLLSW